MAVTHIAHRPSGMRCVPIPSDPNVGHYFEFSAFLSDTFDLVDKPLEGPCANGQDHLIINDAGRYPQDDAAEQLAQVMIDFSFKCPCRGRNTDWSLDVAKVPFVN